jgi:hypothetical protein
MFSIKELTLIFLCIQLFFRLLVIKSLYLSAESKVIKAFDGSVIEIDGKVQNGSKEKNNEMYYNV